MMRLALTVLVDCLAFTAPLAAAEGVFRSDVTGVTPWTSLDFRNDPRDFQFAIVSDNTGGSGVPGVFAAGIEKANSLQPEFVICVGDLIEGAEKEAQIKEQWEEFESWLEPLEMPFFYVVGNHDVTNYEMEKVWLERRGPLYYHFIYKDVLFLCLNTEDPPFSYNLGEEQIAYFQKVLADNPNVRWTLLFLHKPLWEEDTLESSGWLDIEKALGERNYTVVAGHWHQYVKYQRNGRDYYTLGTTGGHFGEGGSARGHFHHITWVTMSDDGPQFANLALDGIYPDDLYTEEQNKRHYKLNTGEAVTSDPILLDTDAFESASTKVYVKNIADIPLNLKAAFDAHPAITTTPSTFDLTVAPGATEAVEVSLNAATPTPVDTMQPLVLSWSTAYDAPDAKDIAYDRKTVIGIDKLRSVSRRESPVTLDGKLEEWDELPFSVRQEGVAPEDASFDFAVAYDDAYLYVAIRAKDNDFVSGPEKILLEQDTVQLWLDARPEAERKYGMRAIAIDMFENMLPLTLTCEENPDGITDYVPQRLPEGLKGACVPTEGGRTAEFAIPVGYLDEMQGKPWERFAMNVTLYDIDAAGGKGVNWRPHWFSFSAPPGAGTFVREQ